MLSAFRFIIPILLLAVALSTNRCFFCMGFSASMSTPSFQKGAAAKPFEKKKIAVFGAAGYLGGCAYGFLQRAGSLYGTGIMGIGAPRGIVASAGGSTILNSVLSRNFALAFADETFVRPTDMTSVEDIQSKLNGFDAAILGTKYCFRDSPAGAFGKGPNDKTKEFYMDIPGSPTANLMDDPEYNYNIFCNTLEACKKSKKLRHLIVVETDAEFDQDTIVGDKYLQLLEEAQVPYTYIRPLGRLESIKNYTFKKGIESNMRISRVDSVEELVPVGDKIIYREHIAAVCVQALITLGWEDNRVIQVEQLGNIEVDSKVKVNPAKEWCVNSVIIQNCLAGIP